MDDLTTKKCRACEGTEKPFTREEAESYQKQVSSWEIVKDATMIQREFTFENFTEAISFINNVARIAEEEGHHPDIYLHSYKNVRIDLSTHAIGGLSENDFIMAAKIDQLL